MSRSCVLACAAVLTAAVPVSAAPLQYMSYDTRTGGSYTIVAAPTNDGNGSLRLTTDTSLPGGPGQAKAGVLLYQSGGAALGTLGTLTAASFDYRVAGTSTTPASGSPAFRFLLEPLSANSAGGLGLVWERANQTGTPTPTDQWLNDQNVIGSNLLWERSNGTNYFEQAGDYRTLADYIAGQRTLAGGPYAQNAQQLSADTPIYGVMISFGSGIPGQFTGYVDDVQLSFSNGTTYSADFALAPVPEPATVAALGLMAACGGLYARRRKAAAL